MIGKKNSCYQCEERHPNCHSECEKYKTFVEEHRKDEEYLRSFNKRDIFEKGRTMTRKFAVNSYKGITDIEKGD